MKARMGVVLPRLETAIEPELIQRVATSNRNCLLRSLNSTWDRKHLFMDE